MKRERQEPSGRVRPGRIRAERSEGCGHSSRWRFAGLGSVLAMAHLGEAGAVPSAFYTALCVVTAATALPLLRGSAPPPSEPG